MVTLVVWTLIALAAAALVLVVASGPRSGDRTGGFRGVLADVRAGIDAWRLRGVEPAAAVLEPEPVDASFDEFFAAAAVGDDGYLRVDELAETLTRARELASRGVGLVRR